MAGRMTRPNTDAGQGPQQTGGFFLGGIETLEHGLHRPDDEGQPREQVRWPP